MKNFNPGKFNTRITLLQKETKRDESRDTVSAWEPVKSVWASKFGLVGTDFYASQTADTKIEVRFSCRYSKDITKEMRIQCGTEVYEIVGVPVDVDNKHAELLIYCKAV